MTPLRERVVAALEEQGFETLDVQAVLDCIDAVREEIKKDSMFARGFIWRKGTVVADIIQDFDVGLHPKSSIMMEEAEKQGKDVIKLNPVPSTTEDYKGLPK